LSFRDQPCLGGIPIGLWLIDYFSNARASLIFADLANGRHQHAGSVRCEVDRPAEHDEIKPLMRQRQKLSP
jgi:hypothetical protein